MSIYIHTNVTIEYVHLWFNNSNYHIFRFTYDDYIATQDVIHIWEKNKIEKWESFQNHYFGQSYMYVHNNCSYMYIYIWIKGWMTKQASEYRFIFNFQEYWLALMRQMFCNNMENIIQKEQITWLVNWFICGMGNRMDYVYFVWRELTTLKYFVLLLQLRKYPRIKKQTK